MIQQLRYFFLIALLLFNSNYAADNNKSNWKFKSGDAVRISTSPDTGFPNGIYKVNEYGYVDLPIIGQINITQIQKDSFDLLLKNAYIGYLSGPHLQTCQLIRISILGGFLKPGLYWINPDATLWDAIYNAGGTFREDGIKKIRWERDGKLVKKNLISDFQSGKSLNQLGFQSGDQISVTSSQKFSSWDLFLKNVVPVLSLAVTTVVAAVTIARE